MLILHENHIVPSPITFDLFGLTMVEIDRLLYDIWRNDNCSLGLKKSFVTKTKYLYYLIEQMGEISITVCRNQRGDHYILFFPLVPPLVVSHYAFPGAICSIK